MPFGWVPGSDGWLGIVPRDGDGTSVRWFRLDPCLVTHVLGAHEDDTPGHGDAGGGAVVLYVCRYDVPEKGQPVDLSASVVGPRRHRLDAIAGGLAVLERWRVSGETMERTQVDDRHLEYPRIDARCEGAPFRYGYGVEIAWDPSGQGGAPVGLLQFDLGARRRPRPGNPVRGAGRPSPCSSAPRTGTPTTKAGS